MRRSIVVISFFVALAALTVLAPATPASGIICPQAIPGCCPPPPLAARTTGHVQPICCQPTTCCATGTTTPQACCPPTTCCATGTTTPQACCPPTGCCTPPCVAGSLTIASSPNPSKAGAKVVISGAITGNPQSGAQVVLWRKPAGRSSFGQMSQTTTDSSGHYTFTLGRGTVMADQAWYVTSVGLRSSTIQQQVSALVGLSASTRSAGVGQAIRLSGRVTPSHAGEVVLVEARRGGAAWRVIARPHLGHGSSYAVSGQFSQPGPVQLRVVLPGDARNAKSTSPTVTVTVRP
jgi:hypothetical protein